MSVDGMCGVFILINVVYQSRSAYRSLRLLTEFISVM